MARVEDIPKEKLKIIIAMIKRVRGDFLISSSLEIRLHKCDYDYDKFIKMHRDTDTELPSIFDEALMVTEIPFEDLPLYINDASLGGRVKSRFLKSHVNKEYVCKFVSARLFLGE